MNHSRPPECPRRLQAPVSNELEQQRRRRRPSNNRGEALVARARLDQETPPSGRRGGPFFLEHFEGGRDSQCRPYPAASAAANKQHETPARNKRKMVVGGLPSPDSRKSRRTNKRRARLAANTSTFAERFVATREMSTRRETETTRDERHVATWRARGSPPAHCRQCPDLPIDLRPLPFFFYHS